jgi:glycosyltransferase involved in cell wall biosynthesis
MPERYGAEHLTVVVIGLNSAATLEGCLRSVRRAAERVGPGVRVLYVDGGSRDDSVAIARGAGAEVIQLVTDAPTAAKGRNAGWRAATTPLVHFVDSDTVFEPDWFEQAMRAIEADGRIAAVFGQLHEANPSGSVYNEVCGCDWHAAPGDWRMCGGNALFRREALEQVGGSDDRLGAGEEADLCWRLRQLGWRIVCIDALMAHHDLGMTGFRAYWRRAVRSGYAYAEVGMRYARTRDPMWLREFVRNLTVPPAALLLAVVAWLSLGAWGVAALVVLAVARLAWKFRTVRDRAAGLRLRALYLVHTEFTRIPLFVGAVQYLLRPRTDRAARG